VRASGMSTPALRLVAGGSVGARRGSREAHRTDAWRRRELRCGRGRVPFRGPRPRRLRSNRPGERKFATASQLTETERKRRACRVRHSNRPIGSPTMLRTGQRYPSRNL
jgi:hypothetical protein